MATSPYTVEGKSFITKCSALCALLRENRRYDADMYNKFDKSCFPEARGTKGYRSPFAVDRDRVIHSRAFRRLQAKTQVFRGSGEYDFYRTRLTCIVLRSGK